MPIYEYRCKRCKREFSHLFLKRKEAGPLPCQYCGSNDLTRLLSSFRVHETEESRVANFDPSKPQGSDFYKDSRNVGLWAKKRMKTLGVDLGSKMDEIVERGRTGKILEDAEK